MRNFVKYAAVGIGGYLIGFYEMKYKVMKLFLEEATKKEETEEDPE